MDHEEDYMDDEDDEENLLGPEGEDTAHPPASAEEIAAPPASSPSPPPPSQQEQSATAATARVPTPQASSAPGAAAGRSFASVAAGSDIARPRLAFSVNDGDAYIQDTKNVLAAVTQVSIGDSVKPMSGRLWEQPCVLYYDIVDTTDPKFKGIISEGGEDSNDSSKPATLVETVVEENLFANPSVKSDVKAILGPVASTVFNAQFGHPNVVKGLEDDFVRDALATLTLCHLVTEDAKKILRTAGPEKIKSATVHTKKTSDNMLVNGDDDEDKMLLSADRMRIANLSSAKMHAENLFLAPKLSGKLRAQLRDTLSVCARRVPEWTSALAKTCPWLFTLDERVLLFHCASFSVARALHQLHGDGKASNGANGNAANAGAANAGGDPRGGARVGRLQRQKVRIRREHALSSAIKVFSSPQTRKHVLEVEFYDEVGTGIGPTNEFYALVSKDLQRASHGIFRSEHSATTTTKTDNAESLVNAPHGLFPKPFRAVPNASKAIEIFRCVGRAIGKVLQDGRLLDVKFNPNFFKKLYGLPLCLDDLELLEPELFSTLKKLETAVRDGSGRLDGAKIEDLCLEFALPDGANIEGASVADEVVTAENASRYIAAVVDDVLGAGVEPLFQACREGFADIVSNPSQLAMFSLSEIDALTCGVDEQTKWSERDLREHILCDHGYQVNSKPVVNLREILTNMSDAERRSFLKFTTGSPRLPIGGLASLNPKLKVVCKQPTVLSEVGGGMNAAEMISEGTELADADLPSAMTCANYLKLPPYSSKEALELKLKLAISEGVGSFDLS
jgi:E3 ubiquitin-protein ligase TRIP12